VAKKRIAIIQGHPDAGGTHFGHALAAAYREGALEAGHEVRSIAVAELDFPLLRSKDDFEKGVPPPPIKRAQATLRWADHLVIVYPLWLGSMPGLLKGFFEQTFRPGFAFGDGESPSPWDRRLKGKSARVVVTMGMPALVYRWFFRAHSVKSLERNILGFCGIGPIRESLIGTIEAPNDEQRRRWLSRMRTFGAEGR
jgi:putative NADPH-quinone reductase